MLEPKRGKMYETLNGSVIRVIRIEDYSIRYKLISNAATGKLGATYTMSRTEWDNLVLRET